jgi:hypothetical protein
MIIIMMKIIMIIIMMMMMIIIIHDYRHVANLPWGGDFPEEAKTYFSPNFLWTRPQVRIY